MVSRILLRPVWATGRKLRAVASRAGVERSHRPWERRLRGESALGARAPHGRSSRGRVGAIGGQKISRSRILGALAALSAASIWGGMYVVSKYVLAFVPPLTLVVIRLLIASLVLGGVLGLTGRLRVDVRDLPRFALCGIVGYTISLSTQFAGTRLATAHDAALITSATPAFIAVFAAVVLGERVGFWRWLAITFATIGVIVVALGQSGEAAGTGSLLGDIFLVIAALTWALYSVLVKAATTSHATLVVTTYAIAAGFLLTSPTVPIEDAQLHWLAMPILAWWGIVYLGVISTAGAFYLWNKGFELLDASVASLFFFAQPIVGGILGWLLLGESLPPTFFAGAVLIATGVILASRAEATSVPAETA